MSVIFSRMRDRAALRRASREPRRREARTAGGRRRGRGLAERAAREDLLDVPTRRVDSPFGPLLAASTRGSSCALAFPEEPRRRGAGARSPSASRRAIVEAPAQFDPVARELDEYFSGRARTTSHRARLDADRAVRATRAGRDRRDPLRLALSYTEVAGEAGSPRGSRAAGNALGSNPIPIVIPCHRVLRRGGALGGYGGGPERKRWLLELEGALEPPLDVPAGA